MNPVQSLLDETFRIADFDCGDPEVNEYLHTEALEDMRTRAMITHVIHMPHSKRILAYISLAMGSVYSKDVGLPPTGVVHVGYVGADKIAKGRGYGTMLLLGFAGVQARRYGLQIGCLGLGLSCRERLLGYYLPMGFVEIGKRKDERGFRHQLYLPVYTPGKAKPQ